MDILWGIAKGFTYAEIAEQLGISKQTVPLPTERLVAGRNAIDLRLEVVGITRGFLSSLYIGSSEQLVPHSRLRVFLLEHLRLMVFAAQLLMTVGVLAVYYRPLMLIAFSVILMRRLGLSLQRLDGANAYLKQRLAQQEMELARLHQEERIVAAQRVRDEERQRLTVDLHDGLSGHLASIIALAERQEAATIEQTAREALDDLRLVIHSLDIGDRELPVALASFRERLMRQLKRLGIELDWSISKLPEVTGVTPAHALNVLRILQEAITNARKHGQATRITLRAGPNADGKAAVIVVDNEGIPFVRCDGGSGLNNMRWRAARLGGTVHIETLANGTRVILALPLCLPENHAAGEPTVVLA